MIWLNNIKWSQLVAYFDEGNWLHTLMKEIRLQYSEKILSPHNLLPQGKRWGKTTFIFMNSCDSLAAFGCFLLFCRVAVSLTYSTFPFSMLLLWFFIYHGNNTKNDWGIYDYRYIWSGFFRPSGVHLQKRDVCTVLRDV